MYNIKAAVGRLDFAPETSAMEVTDIATGHFVFSPVAGKQVSYSDLNNAITDAGYQIEKATITITGKVLTNAHVRVEDTGQTFHLAGAEELSRLREEEVSPDSRVTVSGQWKTEQETDTIVVEQWSTDSQ